MNVMKNNIRVYTKITVAGARVSMRI